ncbi:hypothetical protein TNCT_114961 [Trichonephila clavata]|uniref:Uncharacterized protein n=1 Tax=Trichonephila clavata TaxID=2740835 RepID=A0A8X6LS85_TRICU|nr:hypothetical protein TNCT_114961 [Trichonephila clavata]
MQPSQNLKASCPGQHAFETVESLICVQLSMLMNATFPVAQFATFHWPPHLPLPFYNGRSILSAIDLVSRNHCTKRVIVDTCCAVSHILIFLLQGIFHTAMRFCSETKLQDSYSLLLEKHNLSLGSTDKNCETDPAVTFKASYDGAPASF